MKFEHTGGPTNLRPPETRGGGVFVNVFCGPESIVSYGGSATRKQLSILAASGYANLTYEETLMLKAWLNENVE